MTMLKALPAFVSYREQTQPLIDYLGNGLLSFSRWYGKSHGRSKGVNRDGHL